MRLQNIREDDIVRVDKKGRRFYAVVREVRDGELIIKSLERGYSGYPKVRAFEVIEHYRKSRSRPARRREVTP